MANFEKYLTGLFDACLQLLNKKYDNPFVWDYAPETDKTPTMEKNIASWYHSLVGMLRCMVEIGRVGIIAEMSMIAPQMAMPSKIYLEALFHVF